MANSAVLPRKLLVFLIVLPLAAILGYILATPDDFRASMLVLSIGAILLAPIFLRWHHTLLIFAWNAAITVFLLPGQPQFWMIMAGISFGISTLERLLTKKTTATFVPSLVYPLVLLAFVTLLTAHATGGIGFRALGGQTFGGRWYFNLLFAILGYFAFTAQRISPEKAKFAVLLFFGSALTSMVSNLAYYGGPSFYFLYYLFPVDLAMQQAVADWTVGSAGARLTGFALAAPAITAFILVKYGVRGTFDLTKPWRLLVLVLSLFLGLLGGFRSNLVMFGMLFGLMFYLEGLYRTRILPLFIFIGVIVASFLVVFSKDLPYSVQRSLSVLPVEVDPAVKFEAELSTDWRLRMWKVLLPEVPKYFFKGKGYAIDATELYLMQEAVKRGLYSDLETFLVSGSYHSGPLTLLIPFGIWGTLAFACFAVASVRILYRYFRDSPSELKALNTFLLAFFVMRLLYFLLIYGQFGPDLFLFTGVMGLSVSVNGAPRKNALVETEVVESNQQGIVPAMA